MTVGAIVAAAGRGERLGADVPKALVRVAGEPLVAHACRALADAGVSTIVVTAPPDAVEEVAASVAGARVVAGGATRVDSVRVGLAALPDEVDVVVVHDAARAFAPSAMIRVVIDAVRAGADAVVPVVAVADTVKEVSGDTVVRTVDRSTLRAVQTPQGFQRSVLEAAHASDAPGRATDDASLVESTGVVVQTVPGSPEAFKVTTRFDLEVAEALLRLRVTP